MLAQLMFVVVLVERVVLFKEVVVVSFFVCVRGT